MTNNDARCIAACTEVLLNLAKGKAVDTIKLDRDSISQEIVELCEAVSNLANRHEHVQKFMCDIAAGNLNSSPPPRDQSLAPLKELQANLRHLVWQARQIADGDLSQRVDFLGDFSISFNSLIESLKEKKRVEEEIRLLNQELTRTIEKLEASNEELESFSYSVSHDLRSPLRHVSGYATLLMQRIKDTTPDSKAHQYASSIVRSVKRMDALIHALLDFSRLGRLEMNFQPVEFDDLIRVTLKEIRWQTDERKITWQIDPLPSVHGDPTLLGLVVTNLLTNAVKFTQSRNKAVIEIGHRENETECTFFIRDNGVGFDMASAPKLFSLFQRLHLQQDFEGTGVGLANTRRIISRHGGKIWAESSVDQGATFYFTLPKNDNRPPPS